jgi:hypothetical protein
MTFVEDVKASVQRVSGWRRPSVEQLARLVQSPRIAAFRFRDDGFIPNSPLWPVVVYRSAVKLPRSLDPAAVWEALFESNGWGDTWRNGIYDYLHYHSRIHEVLGIARGSATVRLGGNKRTHRQVQSWRCRGHSGWHRPSVPFCQPNVPSCRRLSAEGYLRRVWSHGGRARSQREGRSQDRTARKDPMFGSDGPLRKTWKSRKA